MKAVFTMTAVLALALVASSSAAQQKRATSACDCVNVRDLQADESTTRSTIKISPDGSRVAYPVRSPNLNTNTNEILLYVRRLPADPDNPGTPILVGEISAIQWRPDSRHLTFLKKESAQRFIEELDSVTGKHRVLFKAHSDIPEYSIDQAGTTLIYAEDVPREIKKSLTQQEIAKGYRIPFQTPADASWPKRRLFVVQWTGGGWTTPTAITISSPLSQQPLSRLAHASNSDLQPTVSPDGKKVLLSYWDFSPEMPEEWRKSGNMRLRNSAGVIQAFHLLLLYDLATQKSSVGPLQTPWVYSAPLWSPDSDSFVAVAQPPINSPLEQENEKTHLIGHSAGAHLFWVEPSTGRVEDVVPKLAYPWGGPLLWDKSGGLLVQVASMDTITRYSRVGGKWQALSSFQIPIRTGEQMATDGKYVVGEFSDTVTPSRLFVFRPGDKEVQIFAKLNPKFDDLTLGKPQEVHWKTSTGFDALGLLLLPPNYVRGNKYPLVIQTKPFGRFFTCSFGNFPSFAPQPISNAGILYLGQIGPEKLTQREEDYFPKGYPGGVAEAAFAMDLWDSAVKTLDQQGVVDTNRVGIIGFSRTGWYTEFILAHSQIHYSAATVADNVQYSVGEYWLSHDTGTLKEYDLTYGGPPYGTTLKNWLDYSVSFNLGKIHTPLLMEEMGYGIPYDNPASPPPGLAAAFEVFTGLNRLNKPVELYYYPNEGHMPDHPQARLATMQRNVDWYRFWLKDEEDPDPAKAEQYVRWRELQKLQQQQNSPANKPN